MKAHVKVDVMKKFLILSCLCTLVYVYLSLHIAKRGIKKTVLDNITINQSSRAAQNKTYKGKKCVNVNSGQVVKFYKRFRRLTGGFQLPLIISPEQVCGKKNNPYIIIIVASVPEHSEMRKTIRETWASFKFAGPRSVETDMSNITIGLVFILAKRNMTDSNPQLDPARNESELYGDILQVDIKETYSNLIYKVLAGLKWMADNCKNSTYLLKVDEDVYVHLPRLVQRLERYKDENAIIGYVQRPKRAERSGKYALSLQQFKFCRLSAYAEGNSYIVSAGLVPKLLRITRYINYGSPYKIEDYYITGILRSVAGVKLIHDATFAKPLPSVSRSNWVNFYKYKRTSETRCSSDNMKTLWSIYQGQQTQFRIKRPIKPHL